MRRPSQPRYERYELQDSPWVQNLTQKNFAELLGTTKGRLETIISEKDRWVKREEKVIGQKVRNVALPIGKLRTIHERIKYHLNKIKHPPYLYSPRKGRGQRDNAALHASSRQILSIDIRQFYPSTKDEHIFRWAHHVAGLRADVAGLFVHLVAVDGRMPFGSPVSPVLTAHVHRPMFDEIAVICAQSGLKMSLWVDDLTISGDAITGVVLDAIRTAISRRGFQTHKIKFRTANRPVIITGVPVASGCVEAPRGLHARIESGYAQMRSAANDVSKVTQIEGLLSSLGSYRYHVGASTDAGRRAANRMHALRQRRSGLIASIAASNEADRPEIAIGAPEGDAPWDE